MPPLGFGRKEQPQSFTTNITDKEDLEEIREIAEMLNPNEEVFVVARQSRLKPGGSAFTPNIVFGTDRRIIIKDPSMLAYYLKTCSNHGISFQYYSNRYLTVQVNNGIFNGLNNTLLVDMLDINPNNFIPMEDLNITVFELNNLQDRA